MARPFHVRGRIPRRRDVYHGTGRRPIPQSLSVFQRHLVRNRFQLHISPQSWTTDWAIRPRAGLLDKFMLYAVDTGTRIKRCFLLTIAEQIFITTQDCSTGDQFAPDVRYYTDFSAAYSTLYL